MSPIYLPQGAQNGEETSYGAVAAEGGGKGQINRGIDYVAN